MTGPASNNPRRPRRLRRSATIRDLVRETRVHPSQLVLPLFVIDGADRSEPIGALPGCSRMSIDRLVAHCELAASFGVRSFALFPYIDASFKSPGGEHSLDRENVLCRAVAAIKRSLPESCVITDIALDPYSSVGHDGLVQNGVVLNDETVVLLAKMAVVHAAAGADMVAPSDMMDGRVGAIRRALDDSGSYDVAIMSYAAKYASSLYGPFRDALDSAPVAGDDIPPDKKTYQMDPANIREAAIEFALDAAEGADILMVKPALHYLDVIAKMRSQTSLPIAAYHVSGEYAMAKLAVAKGWLDERTYMTEALTAIVRAGADIVLTYAALDYARWWRDDRA